MMNDYSEIINERSKNTEYRCKECPEAIFTMDDIKAMANLSKPGVIHRQWKLHITGVPADSRMSCGARRMLYTKKQVEAILNYGNKKEGRPHIKATKTEKKIPLWTAKEIADILKVKVGFIHNRIQRLHVKGKLIAKGNRQVSTYTIEQIREIARYKNNKAYKCYTIDLENTPWSLHELCVYYWPNEWIFPAIDDPHEWDTLDEEIMKEYQHDMEIKKYELQENKEEAENEISR